MTNDMTPDLRQAPPPLPGRLLCSVTCLPPRGREGLCLLDSSVAKAGNPLNVAQVQGGSSNVSPVPSRLAGPGGPVGQALPACPHSPCSRLSQAACPTRLAAPQPSPGFRLPGALPASLSDSRLSSSPTAVGAGSGRRGDPSATTYQGQGGGRRGLLPKRRRVQDPEETAARSKVNA